MGFKNIIDTGNMKGARDAFLDGDVHLLVGETDLPEGDLGELIHQVRHQEFADSPFVVVVAIISELARCKSAIKAGADDVLLKPLPTEKLCERILSLTQNRMTFAVGADYTGPDRNAINGSDDILMTRVNVPNPLHVDFTSKTDEGIFHRASKRAIARINQHKVEHHAFEVRRLVKSIAPNLQDLLGSQDGSCNDLMGQLYWVSRDMNSRVTGTGCRHAAYLCQTLVMMLDDLLNYPDMAGDKEAALLDKLSRAIKRACMPDGADLLEMENPDEESPLAA